MKNNFFVHPSSIVDTNHIGDDSRIWAFVHILKGAVIGKKANICDFCFVENEVIIGDNVTVKCGVYLWDGVTVENNVFIGPSAVFTNDLLPRSKNTNYIKRNIVLKDGCSVGANATIIAGITVGANAMIGAGSVVTKDIGDYELVYGNPAVHKGYVCKCGEKLIFKDDKALCKCGLFFRNKDKVVSII